MFRFSHPEFLYLLLIIPALLLVYTFSFFNRKKRIATFGNIEIIHQLMPDVSFRRGWIKFSISLLIAAIIIFGIAGPQFGSRLTEVNRKGIELIIALDVSNSMMAQDIRPNRLERAKMAITQLVDRLTNDRIGLIVFAGDAYVQLPVTSDYVSAKMFLSSISPGIVPKQGTAIGAAIGLAASSFSPREETKKVLIVISDGENHEDNPIDMANATSQKGIVIHTIGIGSPQGAPVPLPSLKGNSEFLKNKEGQVVVSRLDEEILSKIAVIGVGKYVRATNTQLGLMPLFDEINRMERSEFKEKVYADFDDQFQYLFALALIITILDFFILERKNRWFKRINLFERKN
jgi:Ca-activated chloride channel family protein